MKLGRCILVPFALAAIPACLRAEDPQLVPPPPSYSASIGFGRGSIYKGLLVLPTEWTAAAPEVEIALDRTSRHVEHNLRLSFAPSGSTSTDGVKRQGDNSFLWIPADYSFTWVSDRELFGIRRLHTGLGATLQWMRLKEAVDLQAGHGAAFVDDFFGLGFHVPLRWTSASAKWKADLSLSLTAALPMWNETTVESNLLPASNGGLWWGRTGLNLGVERRIAARWSLGLAYRRDVFFLLRTNTGGLSIDDMTSAGSYLISGMTVRVRHGL